MEEKEKLKNDAIAASRSNELCDCAPSLERGAKTPSQRINEVLESLTLEVQAAVHSHARRGLLQVVSDVVTIQRERDAREITRLTVDRNNVYNANAIMREALERIWRGSDTTLGESRESAAATYQRVAHDALVAANKAIHDRGQRNVPRTS